MVRITNVLPTVSGKGEEFYMLQVQGSVEMIQSKETGRFYATAPKCRVSCTFDEQTAKGLIGEQMPGKIVKAICDPYEYVTEDGEILQLSHRWEYTPEGVSMEETVFEENLESVV
jgi:hypothetical protein